MRKIKLLSLILLITMVFTACEDNKSTEVINAYDEFTKSYLAYVEVNDLIESENYDFTDINDFSTDYKYNINDYLSDENATAEVQNYTYHSGKLTAYQETQTAVIDNMVLAFTYNTTDKQGNIIEKNIEGRIELSGSFHWDIDVSRQYIEIAISNFKYNGNSYRDITLLMENGNVVSATCEGNEVNTALVQSFLQQFQNN